MGFLLPSTESIFHPVSIGKREAPRPESLAQYQARGGYRGLLRALAMDPAAIVEEVEASDLRGRGGAGFPTGRKWRLVRAAEGGPRYLVVNGAEGEPGSVKDRRLMASAPHAVLEGLMIAAHALEAAEVPFYLNDQFQDAQEALTGALSEVAALGDEAKSLADRVRLVPETHVYIAGEETALLNVLMGLPAQPWHKPPYPSDRGYRNAPTAVNNVETLAAVAALFQHDAGWFRANRPALFSVSGDVVRPGVYERPLGYPLDRLLTEAGGPPAGETFSAVLPGGYSMPPLYGPDWNIPLDPDALRAAGTGLGASIIVVATNRTLGAVAHDILQFFARESCGKCPVCVKGSQHLAEALLPAATGALMPSQLADLVTLAQKYRHKGICSFLDSAAHVAEAMAPRLAAD